jgi:cell wall-associated NlpC family hydrolase
MNKVTEPDSMMLTDSLVFVECTMQDSIIDYADNFLGIRYRYGGKSKKGFDCTGFVQTVFERFGYTTPRSSSAIRTVGKEIKRDLAQAGDIIYFKGRNARSKRPGHVGIITEIKKGVIYFIHASVNHGISYSSTNSRYYKKRYLGVRRVIEIK